MKLRLCFHLNVRPSNRINIKRRPENPLLYKVKKNRNITLTTRISAGTLSLGWIFTTSPGTNPKESINIHFWFLSTVHVSGMQISKYCLAFAPRKQGIKQQSQAGSPLGSGISFEPWIFLKSVACFDDNPAISLSLSSFSNWKRNIIFEYILKKQLLTRNLCRTEEIILLFEHLSQKLIWL